ncbi:hypothetical protein CPB84DRAFT_579375 [Gymnopilus junonius]|uniref:Uncharacterized protein n=1 Tax=Gymnopilus junonius TaxID=109634 RepID=A0A9P5N8C3_GYMJU|nr:hypothetical protein CPB84DRAFT_579375 [Gymnopilus junonius]
MLTTPLCRRPIHCHSADSSGYGLGFQPTTLHTAERGETYSSSLQSISRTTVSTRGQCTTILLRSTTRPVLESTTIQPISQSVPQSTPATTSASDCLCAGTTPAVGRRLLTLRLPWYPDRSTVLPILLLLLKGFGILLACRSKVQ